MAQPFDAVLLISFGGPLGPGDVRPFLENVLRGRPTTPERIDRIASHYHAFGGVSPLTALTLRQARALEARLSREGASLPVFVGMRNWHPFLHDTLQDMSAAGVRRAVGLIAAPHRSFSSCEQYRRNVEAARAAVRSRHGRAPDVIYVGDWHTHPELVAAHAARIERALARLPAALQPRAGLIFTAHSLPEALARRGPYVRQIEESAGLVAQAVGLAYRVVYQSRSGRPEEPWLGPDVNDHLREVRQLGLEAAVICPIGFVCDHLEVLYDLDVEAAATCREIGLPMVRAESVNDDPRFIAAWADAVTAVMSRYARGRPLSLHVSPGTPHSRIAGPAADTRPAEPTR